jgi:uncharacterized protein (TIGR02118 family)
MAQVDLICIIKAKPGQSREEFEERWVGRHSKFGAQWKNVKSYRILLPDPEVHAFKGEGVLFDGIAEMVWDSKEEMEEDMGTDIAKAGFADGNEFLDCIIDLYCVEHVIK